MQNHKEKINILISIESKYNVNLLKHSDICFWPLLRLIVYQGLNQDIKANALMISTPRNLSTPRNGLVHNAFRDVKVLIKKLLYSHKLKQHSLANNDEFVFISRPENYSVKSKKGFLDKHIDINQ